MTRIELTRREDNMKSINGRITSIAYDQSSAYITFSIPKWSARAISQLDNTKLYNFKIERAKSVKTLQQNRAAWMLMTEIARELDMFPNAESVYMTVIRLAHIKTTWLMVMNDSRVLSDLVGDNKPFRCIKTYGTQLSERGVEMIEVEGFYGLSKFNRKEHADFIDKLLYFAEMNGIDTEEYFDKS